MSEAPANATKFEDGREFILVRARYGIEAQFGLNDVWPGDEVWVEHKAHEQQERLRKAIDEFWISEDVLP